MSIIVSHPTGNSNVRAVIKGFAEKGVLHRFYTSIAVKPNSSWLKFLPDNLHRELCRREYPVPYSFIKAYPWLEAARMLLSKAGLSNAVKRETGWASIDKVYQHLDKIVAKTLANVRGTSSLSAVYSYEDGALHSFLQAKKQGITCVYDLPIAHWQTVRRLLQQESERLPQWAATLGGGITDSAVKLERKTKELQLADIVVVPSKFVADSLPEEQRNKKIITAPFGSPASQVKPKIGNSNQDRPLRVLFVGSMGQRKGLADLFEAVKMLNTRQIELVVLGSLLAPLSFYKNELPDFTYEPGRSHAEVLQLMQTCDVFCLPSIAEGRALVMQEAMSQGLPLIITPNTGGEDLIIEKETGFLVPTSSPEAIAEKLNWYLENRRAITEMGQQACKHAATYTWQQYSATIINGLINEEQWKNN